MAGGIKPYEAARDAAKKRLAAALLSGSASATALALARRSLEVMERELANPLSVLIYDALPADGRGFKGADRWRIACEKKAADDVVPEFLPPDALLKKAEEYLELGRLIVSRKPVRQQAVVDKQNGKSYLIHGELPIVADVMKLLASELMAWFRAQPNSKAVMSMSARAGLATMLSERPDLVVLVRLAQNAPLDSEVRNVPVDRPAVVEAIELAIAFVPVVGNAVAAYEAYTGKDLFGYSLTDVERGILGVSVLLPIAGRLVKGGRVLYTEARLVQLYGRDAAAWSKVVKAGGRAETAGTFEAIRDIENAAAELRAKTKIVGQVATEAAPAIKEAIKGSSSASSAVDAEIAKLLGDLHAASSTMKSLDAPAIRRCVEKGPNVDHLKGQLLEELLESKVLPWLRTRTGSFALGVQVPAGKKLEFIPGHMLRDVRGRQITDGILAYRDNGVLEIVAVFEAKAGQNAARELSKSKGSLSSLTEAERAELRAYARDILRDRRLEARRNGKLYRKKLADIMREIALSEHGGQVRRDIERLSQSTAGRAVLNVGSELIPVSISVQKTKFFGIVPKNTTTKTIEAQLQKEKFRYEMIAVDIKASELKTLSEKMKPLAEKLAAPAP
jgi:hypothetical protein